MKLIELFPARALELEILEGYVKSQQHPFLPLTILNYTDKATYERRWNAVTLHCRGLIIQSDTGEIIARGPRKFFNYGEPSAKQYPLGQTVEVTTKHDGSLGIGWVYQNEAGTRFYGIATRGSFTSEQAYHATQLMTTQRGHGQPYELMFDTLDQYAEGGISYICEIVYPENRIVLDYGIRDELLPLGTVNHQTGLIQWRPKFDHHGFELVPNSNVLGPITLGEALSLSIPDDEEGYVLDILVDGEVIDHIKLKGDRYKELHAAIFGLSEKAIWEQMVEGTHHDFIAALPDEVQPWAHEVSDRLSDEFEGYFYLINYVAKLVQKDFSTRKEMALYLRGSHPEITSPVFSLLDGKEDRMIEWVWKKIKPGHVPFSASKALESASV